MSIHKFEFEYKDSEIGKELIIKKDNNIIEKNKMSFDDAKVLAQHFIELAIKLDNNALDKNKKVKRFYVKRLYIMSFILSFTKYSHSEVCRFLDIMNSCETSGKDCIDQINLSIMEN